MTPTANQNLRGKVYLTFDSSGLLKHNSYYFDGQLYEVDRRMAADYKTITDWQTLNSSNDPDTIVLNADSLLETEIFQQQFVYNVQGQVNRYQMPKGGNTNQIYDFQGRLYRTYHRTENNSSNNSYGEQIYFNARGQRERIRYGNNTQSWLTYDDKTFRLKRLLTTKNSDGSVLQDLNYTYDPVGNITEMTDNAQQTIFFNNTQVNPTRKYRYDALYRLIAAEGREFANNNTAPGPMDAVPSVLPDNNSAALRIYDQQYTYDEMGNILQQAHNASGGSWNRFYHYAANNFLLSTSTDGTQPTIDQYTYDAHGNMLQMPHLASISWDHNDNMQEADLGGGGTAYYVYNVAGERIRKVIENGAIKEDRLYIGGRWELYRKSTGGTMDTERESVHIFDDQGARIALIDKTTLENGKTLGTPTVLNRFHLSNHLGSSNLELDYSAALISYEEYYPFGSTSYQSGRNQAETSLKRFRYVGKERDNETGLYYYGARYYASWLCRFVSVDPLKDDYPQLNPYNYADNNPVSDLDIDGQQNTRTKKQTPKSLEKGKAGDIVTLPNGSTALMMEEVVVSGNSTLPSPQKLDFERKTDYSGEKENLVKSASQEGLKKGGKEFAESASNIEEARSEAGILKTNEGQEVKGRPVEKKVKQIGASGNEEIVTKLRGRNQGIGKPGVTTKGIEDVSNIETKLLRGTGTLLKETSELIDFAYLSKAFATGNVDDLINAFPLGMVTQDQIAQFSEVSTQVGITKLGKLIAEGATPLEIRNFLESNSELNFMVIFSDSSEAQGIQAGKINSLDELYDPRGNEITENAHLVLTNTKDISFNYLFSF